MGEHSRELSNFLLCHESESSLNEEDETILRSQEQEHHCFVFASTIGDEEEEYVAELVHKENQRFETESMKTTSCVTCVDRLIAIDWILTTRTRFGFQHQTAYIAISYFDLFLQKRIIGRDESWAIRLLSVSCLSLAAKMEERIVPGLSQYPQDQDFVFKSDVILKTELMILSTLNWKMNLITPFHYLNYFVAKISKDVNKDSVSQELVLLRSSESLLDLTKEIRFMDYQHFIVAASTVILASFGVSLTKEEMASKFESISWWNSIENDNVYSCYQRMQEIEERKHMTPPEVADSGDVQPFVSESRAKRGLLFDDSDPTFPAKRMCRI